MSQPIFRRGSSVSAFHPLQTLPYAKLISPRGNKMKQRLAILLIAAWLTGCLTQERATSVAELSHKLATGKFETTYIHGKLVKCTVTQSTGDRDLDQGACEVARDCPAPPVGVSAG